MLVGVEMTRVRAPILRGIAHEAKGLEQRFALQKHLILPPTKDICNCRWLSSRPSGRRRDRALCQHFPRVMIDRMPQPALRVLLPHKGPHLIDFRFVSSPDHHVHLVRM